MRKVAVLGTGQSIGEFNPVDYDWSIGVNDIWKIVKSNDIVCLNPPKDFTPERLKIIQESKPIHFFSQMVIWDTRPDFFKIDIQNGYPDRICILDHFKPYAKSFCSPFVAVQIAWKMCAAQEVHLFGVDLINHPFLNQKLCQQIYLHFQNLKIALTEKHCKLIVHGQGILTTLL